MKSEDKGKLHNEVLYTTAKGLATGIPFPTEAVVIFFTITLRLVLRPLSLLTNMYPGLFPWKQEGRNLKVGPDLHLL
jgi:hypothetical protein